MNQSDQQSLTLLENVDLQVYNSFAVRVTARYFVSVSSVDELRQALVEARRLHVPFLILGGGSNVLFVQDYPGLIVQIALTGIELVDTDGSNVKNESVQLEVAAGVVWHELVEYCLSRGYFGLENLALIPGRVGAAPIQNIGAYGVELKDFLVELSVLMVDSGEIVRMTRKQCEFGYRDSVFKQELKNKAVVLSVRLQLSRLPRVNLDYAGLRNVLTQRGDDVTPAEVFEAVCAIRREKLPDPATLGNAGSFFKNPVVAIDKFKALQQDHPEMPSFPVWVDGPDGRRTDQLQVKLPAAWLIEKAGLKGRRKGNVGVHTAQALVLVNYGAATGREVLEFAKQVGSTVWQQFGVQLEAEVQLIN